MLEVGGSPRRVFVVVSGECPAVLQKWSHSVTAGYVLISISYGPSVGHEMHMPS